MRSRERWSRIAGICRPLNGGPMPMGLLCRSALFLCFPGRDRVECGAGIERLSGAAKTKSLSGLARATSPKKKQDGRRYEAARNEG